MQVFRTFFAMSLLFLSASASVAQTTNWSDIRDVANSGTVGIMGGGVTGTSATLVWDLTNALDDGYNLRIVPLMGKGSVQTIEDIMVLSGVDIGIVQSDVIDFYERTVDANIKRKIAYIARFYDEEMHLIARSGISDLQALRGRRVNLGPRQSGNFMTASTVLDRLGIEVEASSYSHPEALELLRKNELDAMIRVAGKPTGFVGKIASADGLKLLPIPAGAVGAPYVPSRFMSQDYPALVPEGTIVNTIAVPSVMAAYNWPLGHERRGKVEKFVRAFYAALPLLQTSESFHPKWRQVDAGDEVAGWSRFALTGGS